MDRIKQNQVNRSDRPAVAFCYRPTNTCLVDDNFNVSNTHCFGFERKKTFQLKNLTKRF